jgi:hypothetical protein
VSKKPLITDQNNPLKRHAVVTPVNPYRVPTEVENEQSAAAIVTEPETPKPKPAQKASKVQLKQYGTYLKPESIKALRRVALDKEVPDYQVVQAAVDEYLEKHKS